MCLLCLCVVQYSNSVAWSARLHAKWRLNRPALRSTDSPCKPIRFPGIWAPADAEYSWHLKSNPFRIVWNERSGCLKAEQFVPFCSALRCIARIACVRKWIRRWRKSRSLDMNIPSFGFKAISGICTTCRAARSITSIGSLGNKSQGPGTQSWFKKRVAETLQILLHCPRPLPRFLCHAE